MEQIILFGASLYGKIAFKILSDQYDIVAFSDNDEKKWGDTFCDTIIIPPEQIEQYQDTTVVIASQYYYAIGKQLKQANIENIKIFFYKGLLRDLEYYDGEYLLIESEFKDLFENITLNKKEMPACMNWNKKTHSSTKKVLFIAAVFPPLAESGVQRSLKFVKYLKEFGYDSIVVTVDDMSHISKDETLLEEIPETTRIVRIKNTFSSVHFLSEDEQQEIIDLYYGITQSEEWIQKYIHLVRNQYEDMRNILIPEDFVYWANQVIKQIGKVVDMNEIDVIFTTGFPYSDYFIGYYFKKKYGIPWVIDDRDSWTANKYMADIQCFKNRMATYDLEVELQKKLTKFADKIVVTCEKIKHDYMKKFELPEEVVTVITNGYDEADFENLKITENLSKFTICYNGWLRRDRNPEQLLSVVNDLIREEIIDVNKIEWVFNGNIQRELKEKMLEQDENHILKFNGYLEHHECISIAAGANMLVLYGGVGEGTKVMYTGKIFEYLRLMKPILGFSTPDGIFDQIFLETGCGENYDYEDIDGMKKFVLQLYLEWENRHLNYNVNHQEIRKYERKKLTEQLANIFNDLTRC